MKPWWMSEKIPQESGSDTTDIPKLESLYFFCLLFFKEKI
jgi:hypothetical protein